MHLQLSWLGNGVRELSAEEGNQEGQTLWGKTGEYLLSLSFRVPLFFRFQMRRHAQKYQNKKEADWPIKDTDTIVFVISSPHIWVYFRCTKLTKFWIFFLLFHVWRSFSEFWWSQISKYGHWPFEPWMPACTPQRVATKWNRFLSFCKEVCGLLQKKYTSPMSIPLKAIVFYNVWSDFLWNDKGQHRLFPNARQTLV